MFAELRMDRNDVMVTHFYHGPGKGGSYKVTHIPTGLEVEETQRYPDVPSWKRVEKLIAELAQKLEAHLKRE